MTKTLERLKKKTLKEHYDSEWTTVHVHKEKNKLIYIKPVFWSVLILAIQLTKLGLR